MCAMSLAQTLPARRGTHALRAVPPVDRTHDPRWAELVCAPNFECAGVLEDAVSATPSLHADTWALELLAPGARALRIAAVHHPRPSHARGLELALRSLPRLAEDELQGAVIRRGEFALHRGDRGLLSPAARARLHVLRARSWISVPLLVEAHVVGALSVARSAGPALNERDALALACCALQIEACWREALAALTSAR
jgi:hypothetical protein